MWLKTPVQLRSGLRGGNQNRALAARLELTFGDVRQQSCKGFPEADQCPNELATSNQLSLSILGLRSAYIEAPDEL
ncbi:MAG: hypothetical protein NVSMB62_25280 [Acidobacteriaceae bacterium]